MVKKKVIKKNIKNLWKNSKRAIFVTIGVAGGLLMLNSFSIILPKSLSFTWQLVLGLSLVLLSGYLVSKTMIKK